QHRTLRMSGRPGRVDERSDIIWAGLRSQLIEASVIAVLPAVVDNLLKCQRTVSSPLTHDHVMHVRRVRADVLNLMQLLLRGADHRNGSGVVEDVFDLPSQQRWINRNGDRGIA